MLERLFAFVFDGLVYPQIWEDPVVDLDAMAIEPGHHVVAITSGGCNVLSYLTADPERITAVDLNQAHLSLLKLKQAAIRHLPSHEDFLRLFAGTGSALNVELYDQLLAHRLDDEARSADPAAAMRCCPLFFDPPGGQTHGAFSRITDRNFTLALALIG